MLDRFSKFRRLAALTPLLAALLAAGCGGGVGDSAQEIDPEMQERVDKVITGKGAGSYSHDYAQNPPGQ